MIYRRSKIVTFWTYKDFRRITLTTKTLDPRKRLTPTSTTSRTGISEHKGESPFETEPRWSVSKFVKRNETTRVNLKGKFKVCNFCSLFPLFVRLKRCKCFYPFEVSNFKILSHNCRVVVVLLLLKVYATGEPGIGYHKHLVVNVSGK